MDKTFSDKLNEMVSELELIKARAQTVFQTLQDAKETENSDEGDNLLITDAEIYLHSAIIDTGSAVSMLKGAVKDEKKT